MAAADEAGCLVERPHTGFILRKEDFISLHYSCPHVAGYAGIQNSAIYQIMTNVTSGKVKVGHDQLRSYMQLMKHQLKTLRIVNTIAPQNKTSKRRHNHPPQYIFNGLDGLKTNPIVRILKKIPYSDYMQLYTNAMQVSESYRYYEMDRTMDTIPISRHYLPNGGAIKRIGYILSEKKRKGIVQINTKCQVSALY
jgi:hypothetical protein